MTASLTHYAPWDEADGLMARCGARVTSDVVHSCTPSCPSCAASLAADEAPLPEREDEADDVPLPAGPDWRRLAALVDRLAEVYTVESDQHALVRLVDDARAVRAGGRR